MVNQNHTRCLSMILYLSITIEFNVSGHHNVQKKSFQPSTTLLVQKQNKKTKQFIIQHNNCTRKRKQNKIPTPKKKKKKVIDSKQKLSIIKQVISWTGQTVHEIFLIIPTMIILTKLNRQSKQNIPQTKVIYSSTNYDSI